MHFLRCCFVACRKHYKNRGFGTSGVKVQKTRFFRDVSVCFGEARDFDTQIWLFWLRVSNLVFWCCPSNHYFCSGLGCTHWVGSCLWARNHYKNCGFGHMGCRRETHGSKRRGVSAYQPRFSLPLPETTVFLVVSGSHTGVLLAHVPETTSFIVVSGTWGDEDKQAQEKKKI